MLKKLIFFIIIAGLVYLNYTNPTRQDHERMLLAEIRKSVPVSEEQFAQITKDVDYSNFMVCSATKTTMDSKMVSLGYLKKTRLVNDQWLKQTMQKFQGAQGY